MAATANGTTSNVHANGADHPKIHLYTNHGCPYAHRAHITLSELGLPFEETIIDLETPRPQWYLDINPRGLVPSIKYSVPGVMKEEILTESAIVSQFLCDAFPSHLMPATSADPTAALRRARINFFVDTWNTKVASYQMGVISAAESEREQKCRDWVALIEKEIEPLLADANPFFGGSRELTFAEVITAPFILRWFALSNDGEVLPTSFAKGLEGLPNFSKWSKAVRQRKSALEIWDEKKTVETMKRRIGQMKAKAKA